MNRSRLLLLSCLVLCLAIVARRGVVAQAPKGEITANDPPPPLTYHGLIPGLSSAADVRTTLGEPLHEAEWYSWKMLYGSSRSSPHRVGGALEGGLLDSVQLSGGKNGRFAGVEAASVPAGYESKDRVRAKLGEPEYELRMATFSMLDYAAKGVRFIFDKKDATIGVAYFPHLRPRVHSGARKFVDLSKLREGSQPRPKLPVALAGLRCGTAQEKITPLSAWLAPQYRAKFRVHDDIWARCALFEMTDKVSVKNDRPTTTVAFVGADLFIMSHAEIQPIIDRLAAEKIHLILAQSHNHAAPDDIGVYGHFPAEHVKYIQEQVVKCVLDARKNLRPVKELRTASRELPMDGARVIGYIRNARNPGLVDPTVNVIQAIGADGKPITTIVNFACHVEGLSTGVTEMSADFPGYMCEQIRADGGGQPVFLNGAVGGMVSGDTKARTHDEAKVCGLGWAHIVKQVLATAQPSAKSAFSFETKSVEIPVTNQRFVAFAALRGHKLVRGRLVTEMSLIRIGEAEMITIPGELLPEVSFEILEKMKGFPRIIVGLANDELGYIIPPYDFRNDSYEETMSQGPGAAPVILDTALRLLAGTK